MSQSFILPKGMRWDGQIARMVAFFKALAPGRSWRITVEEAKSKRSDAQNKYLWGIAYKVLSEHTGYEPAELHEVLLGKHFGEVEKRVPRSRNFPAGVKMVPRRTTTTDENGKRDVLKWDEFSDYVAFVQRTAAKVGCYIPDPNEDVQAAA